MEKYDFSCSSYLFCRKALFPVFVELAENNVEKEIEEYESCYRSHYRGRQGCAKRQSLSQARRRREQRLHRSRQEHRKNLPKHIHIQASFRARHDVYLTLFFKIMLHQYNFFVFLPSQKRHFSSVGRATHS